jgi:3-dehydro-L-gulonate 2-dehydrogenase
LKNFKGIETCINNIISNYRQSIPEGNKEIVYPGERVLKSRERNLKDGTPVMTKVWNEIESLL